MCTGYLRRKAGPRLCHGRGWQWPNQAIRTKDDFQTADTSRYAVRVAREGPTSQPGDRPPTYRRLAEGHHEGVGHAHEAEGGDDHSADEGHLKSEW